MSTGVSWGVGGAAAAGPAPCQWPAMASPLAMHDRAESPLGHPFVSNRATFPFTVIGGVVRDHSESHTVAIDGSKLSQEQPFLGKHWLKGSERAY